MSGSIDPLTMWLPVPVEEVGYRSVEQALPSAHEVASMWRLDMPADMELARKQLAEGYQRLRLTDRSLVDAESRISDLSSPESGVDFAQVRAESADLATAEAELLQMLGHTAPTEAVEFGLRDWLPAGWEAAATEMHEFLARLQRFISHYAWVETQIEGVVIGRTLVSWTGDMRSTWPGNFTDPGGLHRRNLALALASRTTMIRTFAVLTSGSVTIIPLLVMPGGSIVALPAIWKFIKRLRSEWERYSRITQEF